MLPSEKLEPHLRSVQEFAAVLDELVSLLEPEHVRMSAPTWRPNGVDDERAEALIRRGHELAGPATEAFSQGAMTLAYTPPPMTGQPTKVINPAQNWDTIFHEIPMFTPSELRGYVGQVEGRLRARYDQALRRERGFVGLLARFVLLPQRVGEAAGLESGSVARRAAFGTGVFVQGLIALLVGTAAVVLGAGALRLIGWG